MKADSAPPDEVQQIIRTAKLLRQALKRGRPSPLPASFRAMTVGLVRHWMSWRLRGADVIHPGNDQLAAWGECTGRQARTNLRRLEHWEAVAPVAYPKGGRRATRLIVNGEALFRALVLAGCNPSPELRVGLTRFDLLVAARKMSENPEENPEVASAGIHRIQGVSMASTVVPFPAAPDRSAGASLFSFSESEGGGEGVRPRRQIEAWRTFLSIFPRRHGIEMARGAFFAALDAGTDPADIIATASRFRDDMADEPPQWICSPLTWLRNGRWADYDESPPHDDERKATR